MSYATYSDYQRIYPSSVLTESQWDRFSWDAEKRIDNLTSGIDNVKKLKIAFPTNEDDAEAVKRCVCELVDLAYRICQQSDLASGSIVRDDGTVTRKLVTSLSSGSESITFSKPGDSAIADAVSSIDAREVLYRKTIFRYLATIDDANGVSLLYGGAYPCIVTQ